MATGDCHHVIGALLRARCKLELDTTDLCFLVALRARGEHAHLGAYDEDLLYDVFGEICTLIEPDAQNPRKRATHALVRLREQRLLARVDGAGLLRAGEFALTPLAEAIVEFFLAEERLTRESLAALTSALRAHLAAVLADARAAGTLVSWQEKVVAPLRNSVRDLVSGIERRQRGMDAQQEEIRARIGALLQQDWFAAIDDCEALLEETSATLRELNEVLLRDCGHMQVLLQDIEALAAQAGAQDAEAAAQQLGEQLDRVGAWGGARQRAWSDYYQFVQRYLRDVVRLDPERALSQRLRDQIKGFFQQGYGLCLAAAPPIRLLRDEEDVPLARPPVSRPRAEREAALRALPPDHWPEQVEDMVHAALRDGAGTLGAVLARVLPAVAPEDRFLWAGRVCEIVGRAVRIQAELEPAFTAVTGADGAPVALHIEDWRVVPGASRARNGAR